MSKYNLSIFFSGEGGRRKPCKKVNIHVWTRVVNIFLFLFSIGIIHEAAVVNAPSILLSATSNTDSGRMLIPYSKGSDSGTCTPIDGINAFCSDNDRFPVASAWCSWKHNPLPFFDTGKSHCDIRTGTAFQLKPQDILYSPHRCFACKS